MTKYVMWKGEKHEFSTEKEKKALEAQAKAVHCGYTVVDGVSYYRVLSPRESQELPK